MITPAYCVMMARYNAWQNWQIKTALAALPAAELTQDRGAFFKSMLGTANHILWADQMWMSRFTDHPKPTLSIGDSASLMPTLATWGAERFRMDARLILWAEGLRALDLTGELSWYSGASRSLRRANRAQLVVHMFNHQTHHRGQIHAMLTDCGQDPGVTDLAFLPSDGPWM